jgi:asparagine synthase (glutamine-hydrolysing)
MCGINGIFAYHYAANPVDREELRQTRDHMARRGPDASGEYESADHRLGFGHRRLSIIDLSETGAQPMTSADGRFVITFNGEIYNYRELRAGLERRGAIFRSQSDTEVLIHLYAEKGEAMVHELRGMFALGIYDSAKRELFLARDPYGIKPLYYADDGWTFRFASQVKALRAGGRIFGEQDPAGWVGFYLFGSVPEPFTCWREIRALPAGCWMRIDRLGAGAPRQYHSLAAVLRQAEDEAREIPSRKDVHAALRGCVASHLVADVPVGAFLSAGVDSGALLGLMRDAGAQDIQTITLGFEEFRGRHEDETPLAAELAAYYGARHRTRMVSRAEFEANLPRILEDMDQPSIDGVNIWFVSMAAHECGLKVVVSGLGGDELLGGYPSFQDIPRWARAAWGPSRIPLLGKIARHFGGPLLARASGNPKAAGIIEYGGSYAGAYLLKRGLFMPWEIESVLGRDVAREGLERLRPLKLIANALEPRLRSATARVAALEAGLYMRNQLLRDADWASMAHSVEFRTPLVDSRLLARLAPAVVGLAPGEGKRLLANAPSRPLPTAISYRRKTGFGTPLATWMRDAIAKSSRPQRDKTPWARGWSRYVAQQPSWAA